MTGRPSPAEQRELNKLARVQQAREAEPQELAVRHEGEPPSDLPPREVRPKRLTIVESDGSVRTVELDPYYGGYLSLEHEAPRPGEPWITEAVIERFPVFGVESIVLEDVEP